MAGTEHASEVFRYAAWGWNIDKAWEMVREEGNEVFTTAVRDLAKLINAPLGVVVDKESAKEADLERPLLAIRFLGEEPEDEFLMVIDGWHRIYKAVHLEDRDELPVILLTDEQERWARDPRSAEFPRERKERLRKRRHAFLQDIAFNLAARASGAMTVSVETEHEDDPNSEPILYIEHYQHGNYTLRAEEAH